MVSSLSRGLNITCWDARAGVVPGAPLQMTFEPMFCSSEDMFYEEYGSDSDEDAMVISEEPAEPEVMAIGHIAQEVMGVAHVAANMGDMFAHALGPPPVPAEVQQQPEKPAKRARTIAKGLDVVAPM